MYRDKFDPKFVREGKSMVLRDCGCYRRFASAGERNRPNKEFDIIYRNPGQSPFRRRRKPRVMADQNGAAMNGAAADFNRMNINVVTSTNLHCDPTAHREVRVEVRDPTGKPVNIECKSHCDTGVCTHFTPHNDGMYTLHLMYTFPVTAGQPVESKMIVVDGKVTQLPPISPDGRTWKVEAVQKTEIVQKTAAAPVMQAIVEDAPAVERPMKKVSLAKQLIRKTTVSEMVGASNVIEAATKFGSLDEVADIMKKAGLKSSNLIFGIDYTASNKTQGMRKFGGRSLHSIDSSIQNPYQTVMRILGHTLASFARQGWLPAFGFGDVKTSDHSVFPIQGPDGPCKTFDEVLDVYNAITPKTILSGPTNFAPIIYEAIKIYQATPDYYLLVIVADGQVNNEPATVQAIVDACQYPISIVVVGIGDGPWDMMNEFDERIPERSWDNFNFVDFHNVVEGVGDEKRQETTFAVHALVEIPDQYATIKKLGLL